MEISETVCSHDQAVLVVLASLFEFAGFAIALMRGLSRGCGLDDGQALFGSFVTMVRSFDIPNIRLERVTAASDTHFSEVTTGIFGFRKTWTN